MLAFYDKSGSLIPLTNYEDFSIDHYLDGFADILSFCLNPKLPEYHQIEEESQVVYGDNNWLVKKISDETIECRIDFDFLKAIFYRDYDSGSITLLNLLESILPGDWVVIGAEASSIRRTISADFITPYDVLQQAMKTYRVYFQWKTAAKTVIIHPEDENILTGEYITDELNLRALTFTGETTDFATRLYPYGAIDEETGTRLTIASVNNGKEYVENHSYSSKVVCAYWTDERYTVPENLRDDAKEKLKTLAIPARSYECDVADLAKRNPKYSFLAFAVHKVVTLIDRERALRINHKIVAYQEYPDEPDRNRVTLASVQQRMSDFVTEAKSSLQGQIQLVEESANKNTVDIRTLNNRLEERVSLDNIISAINKSTESVTINADKINLAGWTVTDTKIYGGTAETGIAVIQRPTASDIYVFAVGGKSYDAYSDFPFRVTKDGKLFASKAEISGKINADSSYQINSVRVVSGSAGHLYFGASSTNASSFAATALRGDTVRIYTRSGGAVHLGAAGNIAVTADERYEEKLEIDSRYDRFFEALEPVAYRYHVGNRTHIGFGAQTVEKALLNAGLTTDDFAGILIQENADIGEDELLTADGATHFEELYSLRYEEFTALNTLMLQKAFRRIAALEMAFGIDDSEETIDGNDNQRYSGNQ